MWDWAADGIAIASAIGVLFLSSRVRKQADRIRSLEAKVEKLALPELGLLPTSPETILPILEGARVFILIEQDHKLPLVASHIKERLDAEDALVRILDSESEDDCEVMISGKVRCNGYSDVYYEAELTLRFSGGLVQTVAESPPNGARQVNLATRIVEIIKTKLSTTKQREERLRALRELNGF